MKRSIVLSMAVGFLLVVSGGCSKTPDYPNDPESVVKENIKAMNEENLEKVMATIDEQSASFDQTKQLAKKLFDLYDLKYDIDSVKVVSSNEDEARVACVQTTTKLKGPAFRDNKIFAIHSLKKSYGFWKIYNTSVQRLEYLN